ncbi:MAG TPA: ABC transporter permease [Tepidisphaeraceae bacterium]|jgi:peptide/nickel transport system permease protein
MSNTATLAAPEAATSPLDLGSTPRPWLAQVMLDTVSRTGARIGLIWIVIVAFLAAFAPLLSNSYPLLVKMDGRVFSPMVRHLTPADITIFVGILTALVVALMGGIRFPLKLLIIFAAIATVFVVCFLLVHPPETNVYEEYRVAQRNGHVQWAVNALVPYSVGDHMRDQFIADRPHPWPPSRSHWMGTDVFGADIASHMIYACRIAMAVGFISTGISVFIGILVGGVMGYFVGLVDLFGMRVLEVFGAIPTIYLLLTFVAAFPQYRNIYLIMAIIGFTSWVGDARFVRAEFLKLRHQDFVQAAIAAGLPLRSVLFRHLLPNALAPLLVSASFGVAGAILSESVLSFLGLGIPVGDASWGQLLNEAVSAGGGFSWWLATYPGLAIFLTVLAYNLVGESLRDALDPRLSGIG